MPGFNNWSNLAAPQFAYRMRRIATPEPFSNKTRNVSFPPPEQEEEEQSDIPPFNMAMPDYSQMYGDTGPAYQRYQQHLKQVPRMEDYAPSKWRRFGAILAGLGSAAQGKNGYETARGITLDPYATAYENWANQGQGVREAATLEEGAASRKANIYQKILSDYMDQQRWELDYQIKMQNAKTAAERNAITRAFNEATAKYRSRQLDLTGIRDKNTAAYQQSMAGLGRENLSARNREALDRLYLGIRNADTAGKRADAYGRSVDAPRPISGMSQLAMDVGAMQDLERAMVEAGVDPDPYFEYDDYDRVVDMSPTQLPPEWRTKYEQYVTTRRLLGTGGRTGSRRY